MTNNFPTVARPHDFWRVNSYGYPGFFSDTEKSQEAWSTLLSFFDFSDYEELKKYWSSDIPSRKITSHAVESWKATFEEFGILYVETRSNLITITPAGMQLRDAANSGNETEFAWIGLNLLLRYPLRGPRRPKSEAHRDSDLLLYRFIYAALLDLDGYVWWPELERILCRVFWTGDAMSAVQDVKTLRADPSLITRVDLPVSQRQGAFYNSLNQVAVHAGMNHLLLGRDNVVSPYGVTEPKGKHFIRSEWIGMIRRALSNNGSSDQCANGGLAIARIAAAPELISERAYFEYLGAEVTPMSLANTPTLSSVNLLGEVVFFLTLNDHYMHAAHNEIVGSVAALCQLAQGQRLILSHDEQWTYLVESKVLINANTVKVHIRRARPISNISVLQSLREGA